MNSVLPELPELSTLSDLTRVFAFLHLTFPRLPFLRESATLLKLIDFSDNRLGWKGARMNINPVKEPVRQAIKGAVTLTNVVFAGLTLAVIVIVLWAFLRTVKETSSTVSERNRNVIEARKTLVTEQTERLKNARQAQEVP